jgi:multicomponent Na+:H+ antiporter subunit C
MLIMNILGALLILIGLWGIATRKNLFRMIIGFSILDTGINILIVSAGYIKDRTAPILDSADLAERAAIAVVDPVPSALVLTAIVIGLAVTALMLVYAVELHRHHKTLNIDEYRNMKW